MEPRHSDPLRARARSAYELGRGRSAAWTALMVLPFVGCALLAAEAPAPVVALGAALYLLATALLFRGQVYGSAVFVGLVAGAAPMLAPILFRRSGHCCVGGTCWTGCMVACIMGGVMAGLAIGWFAWKHKERPGAFGLAAAGVAALTGSLGCGVAGLTGTLMMMAALAATSIPMVGVARARA
jgi:hypothetical protein